MKQLVLVFLFISVGVFGQKTDYNTKRGFVANGYDVTAYFKNKAVKGKAKFVTTYDGAKFKFASLESLKEFEKSPEMYVPQYGGYCAYAVGLKSEKVSIDPKTFEIREGKLYLFYNSWGTNTLNLWLKEGAEDLKYQADMNWQAIKHQKN